MNYLITTSLPYVNAPPHIGFAFELVMADALARHARIQKKPVIFTTGTDEHGAKIAERAAEEKLGPQEFADKMSQNFRDLAKVLNTSNDRFIRTTDRGHEQRAQMIWKALEKDIYKGQYTGWYCAGEEEFFTEAVVKANNGVCPNHNRKYEQIEEENYLFRLSKYAPQIQDAIETDALRIIPTTRKHEILQVIKDGLDDISISRPVSRIDWGIPVPGDKTQVMYVWFEALMNYLTVLGYPEHKDFKEFWPANVQVIGKDILRFHAAIWPGMLLGLGLPLPKTLFVHGFINADGGGKMSKTLGNVVTPQEILDQYSPDVLRYYLLRHIPSHDDGDFSWDRLHEVYNNELANELGNAVQRTSAMIKQYQDGIIGNIPAPEHDAAKYYEALENCRFDRALDEVWEQVRGLNQYIEESKPWVIAKSGDKEHLREVLAYQSGCLLQIAEMLQPFMPETALKIRQVFESGVVQPIEGTLFPRKDIAENPPSK